MSDDYSMLLIRVLRGEESLGMAFWVTLAMMAAYFAYEYYIPSITDVFSVYTRFFRVFIITYALVSIHHSSHDSSAFPRILARTYVLALLAAADYTVYKFYGTGWAIGYPLMALAFGFVVKE